MSDCHRQAALLFVSLVTGKLTDMHSKSLSMRKALQLRAVEGRLFVNRTRGQVLCCETCIRDSEI